MYRTRVVEKTLRVFPSRPEKTAPLAGLRAIVENAANIVSPMSGRNVRKEGLAMRLPNLPLTILTARFLRVN